MKLVKQNIGIRPYGLNSMQPYVRVVLQTGNQSYFLMNIIGKPKSSTWQETRKNLARRLKNLRANKLKYYRDYSGAFKTPISMLDYAAQHDWEFEFFSKAEFIPQSNTLTLSGNFKQYSCAFRFVFFDLDYFFEKVKPLLPDDFSIIHRDIDYY